MVAHQRIGPDGAFVREIKEIKDRINSFETRPAGQIVIREQLIAEDPVTGEKTILGQLPDGSVGIQPFVGDITPPPVASAPIVSTIPGYFTIGWDGTFVGNEPAPRDFQHVNVVAHQMDGANTVLSVVVGVIRLASETVIVTPDVAPVGTFWQFSLESEDYNGNTAVRSARTASVRMESVVTDEGVNAALEAVQQAADDADAAAQTAQSAAQTAQDAADDAAQAAIDAANLADSKGVIYTQSTAPSGDYSGLWIDTAHNNIPRRFLGVRNALFVNAGGGSSVQTRLSAKGWAVSSISSVPAFEDAVKFDLVAMDAGYAGLLSAHATLAAKLHERGVSLYTSGNDTTNMAPLFTGAVNRGTPKNSIQGTTNSIGISYTSYSDGDLNFYLTGANSLAVVTGTTLVTSLGTNQPINLVMEHPTNFSRWAHIETYATPSAVIDLHLDWLSNNWVAIQDQGVISAAAAAVSAQTKADQAFNNAATAAAAAGTAQSTADGKNRAWYQDDAPAGTSHKVGDTWFDTNDNYKLRTWNGSVWQTTQDSWNAQQTADSKGITYTQPTVPPVEARLPQNLWNDTSLGLDKVVTKYWSTVALAWTPIADKAATEARTVADAKGETIYSDTEPTVAQRLPQNLWVDTTGGININKRWNGAAWVVVVDARIPATATAVTAADAKAQTALNDAATKSIVYTQSTTPPVEARLPQTVWNDTSLGLANVVVKYWDGFNWTALTDKAATDAKNAADAKGETIYSNSAPVSSKQLTQNLWIDTTGGLNINKRWDGFGWIVVADARIASTAAAVTAAQQTADAKSLVYTQPTVPPVSAQLPQTLWNDTSLGLDKVVVKYWAGAPTNAWTALADKTATDAASTANSKGEIIYSDTAPAAAKQLTQNLWVDTTGGLNITKRWDGAAWVVVADSRIATTATAVTAAQQTANDAATSAAAKSVVYTQSTTPPVEARLPQTIWNDTSLGLDKVVQKYWVGTPTNAWVSLSDKTATDAATAATSAQTAANTAMSAQAYSLNASFDDWTGSTPALSTAFTTAPTKETTIVRRAPFAARWNLADTSTQAGLTFSTTSILAHAPNLEYFTVEVDFYLVSGGLGGSGVILDWSGMTNNRAQINFASEITSPVTGKWYTISKTLRRPTNATGTWTGMSGYLMAQWSGHGAGAAKNIIFDWLNIRPSTTEEILAYSAPADAQTKATNAQTAAISAAATDATTKATNAQAAAIAAAAADATTKATNAQTAAIAAAAADATAKADAAKAVALTAAQNAENKVVNGSFELDYDGWTKNTSPQQGIDATVARSGSKSYFTTGGGELLQPGFAVVVGSVWRYEWFYKTEATYVPGSAGGLRLQKSSDNGATWSDATSSSLAVQANWTYHGIEYTVPAGVTHLRARIAFAYTFGPKAWMDDVRLIDVSQIKALEADAQAKADAAQAAAITAAAIDATSKASAAQAAAIAEAYADATAKADAAEAAATAAAALDATAKAEQAEAAAAATAAADATAKADAAEAAAIAAAALTAQLKADGAEQAAIDAAASDAQAKADAAEAAAIAAAALDATAKAEQAEADAITAAASDAQTRATQAKTDAITAAANDATAKSDAAQMVAIQAGAYSLNPSFEDWTGTLPVSYGTFNTVPTKETTTVRTGKFAMRFNCTDSTTQRGVTLHSTLAHAPNLEYFTLELDVRLDSGSTFAGAGVLLDWLGLSNNRVTVSLATEIPSPVVGKWYRVTKVLRRPTNATGTWTAMNGWLMGQYSSGMGTMSVKNVIFDWINIRPATTEEITAYGTPANISSINTSVSALSDTVNTKTKSWFQTGQPPLTGNTVGDLWFDTDDNNKTYIWVGAPTNAWTVASDQRIESLNTAVSAVQTSANGKNKVIWSASDASGTAGYVAGDTWFKRDGSNNVIAQWEFTNSWQPRALSHQVMASIDAAKITVGVLDVANRISANAITTNKLTVSDMEEFIPNPFFHPSGEPVTQGTIVTTAATPVSAGAPYPNAVLFTSRDNHPFSYPNIPVKPGDQFYLEVWVASAPTAIRNFNLYMFGATTPNGGLTAKVSTGNVAPSAAWRKVTWSYTVPAVNPGFQYIRPVLQINNSGGETAAQMEWYATGFSMKRKNTGELIVDGAIKANSAIIENGAISNAQIADATIDTAKIKDAAIKTAKIDDLAVTDGKITSLNAGKITAGYLSAAVIAAGSIKADKLDVTMGGNNLVSNSSFEVDSNSDGLADGWQVWTRGAGDAGRVFTITRPVGLFPGSLFAQRVVSTTVTNTEASSLQNNVLFALAAGDIVTLSLYGRASVAGGFAVSMRCEDDAGTYKGDAGFTAAFTTTTDRYEGTVTIPTGATRAKVTITTPTSLSNGHWFEVDGIKAELGDVSSAWSPLTAELLPGTINATMLTATAIDGKTITGATIQTDSTPASAARGIKLTSTEFAGYDAAGVKNFSLTSTGSLTLKGAITSGSTITGATVTGSTIQTEVTPSRGIKMTTTELAGYDGVGAKNFSLTSAGVLSITGSIEAGSKIKGATVEGAGIETTATANRGVKIQSTGVSAYDGGGSLTFKLDASTGVAELPGLKANSITGDKIAAKAISVDKLTVSDFSNYVENPSFETGDLTGWDATGGWMVNTAAPHTGTYKALVAYNGTTQAITNKAEVTLPVGGKVRVKFRIYSETPSVSGSQAVLALYNVVGGALESVTPITQAGQWIEIDRELTAATAGAKRLQIATTGAGTGYLRVDSIVMNRMMNGELIVDGAIDGKVITGATIQTDSTPASAARGIKLTSSELAGYDAAGVKNFSLTTAGVLAVRGDIQSGSNIIGATITGSTGIQTSSAASRGVKITNSGVSAFDNSGNMTFRVDGTSGMVEAPGIKANSIAGDKITAGTVSADRLLISDFTNLLDDPSIFGPGWIKGGGTAQSSIVADTNEKVNAWRFNAAGWQVDVTNTNVIPVVSTDRFVLSVRAYSTLNASGYVRVLWFNESMGSAGLQDLTIPAGASAWTSYSIANLTPPGAAKFMKIQPIIGATATTGYILYGSMTLRKRFGGELIVDGAINGQTITGATIQTDNTPVSGASARGIKLTTAELAGYDTNGVKNLSLATDGTLTLRGAIQSGSTITGTTITGSDGLQTSIAVNRGVKINNNGVSAYDAGGNLTFKVDGNNGVVEAPGMKANSITGDKIASQTITARNLIIGDFSNIATIDEVNGVTISSYGPTMVSAGYNKLVTDSGSYLMFSDQRGPVPFAQGDSLYYEFTAKATATTTVQFGAWTYDAAAGNSSTMSTNITINTTDTAVTGVLPVTSYRPNAIQFVVGLGSVANKGIQVKNVKVYKMAAGKLIVDGAIDGKVITGATIQTESTASRGIKLTSTEFAGYDGAGVKNFSLTSAGALTVLGTIKSGSFIEGATITGTSGIQTSGATDRGVKITNSGVSAFDNSGNMTFRVNGTTGVVEAPGILANSIKGDKIESGSVTADKILISSNSNAIVDPAFLSPEITAYRVSRSSGTWTEVTGTALLPKHLVHTTTTTSDFLLLAPFVPAVGTKSQGIPVIAGQKWLLDVDVETNISAGVRWNLHVWYSDGTYAYVSASPYSTATGKRKLSYVYDVPANVVAIYPALLCNTSGVSWKVYGNLFLGQQAGTTLIANGAVTTDHISVGTLDGGVITANTLKGTQIVGKSITVDKLVVSSTDNLIVEADFGNTGTSWGTLNANKAINSTAGRGSLPALRVTGSIALQTINNLANRVTVGTEDRFRGSMYVKSSVAAASGVAKLRMNAYTSLASSTPVTVAVSQALLANTWTLVEGYSPLLPANTIAVEFFIEVQNAATGTTLDIDYVGMTRAADGKLVIDGAIDGKTITGALFQTDNTPLDSPDSRGIKLNGAGLKAYDPFGLMTFGIDALTGIVSSVGTFSTESTLVNYMGGTTTARAEFGVLNNATFNNVPGITFQWGAGNEPNQITSALYSAGGTTTLESRSDAVQVLDQSRVYLNIGQTQAILEAVGPQVTEADWSDRAGFYANGFGYNSSSAVMQTNLNKTNAVEGSREMAIRVGEFPGYSDGLINMYHDKMFEGTRYKGFQFLATPSGAFQMTGYKENSYTIGARILHDPEDNFLYLSGSGGLVAAAPEVVLTPMGNINGDQVILDDTGIHLNGTVTINGAALVTSQSVVHMMTASGTMAAATVPVPQIGALSTDTGGSSGTLATPGTGQITITEAGVYDLSFTIGLGGPMTGRSFIDITPDGQAAWARATIAVSEDSGTASINGVKVSAGQVVKFYVYQTSGGTKSYTAAVRIVKVGSPSSTSNWTNTSQTIDGNVVINGSLDVPLINGSNTLLQHAEFTASYGIPNATLWGPNAFTLDSSKSVNGGFAYSTRVDHITIAQTGVYQIDTVVDTGSNSATNTYMTVKRVSDSSLIAGGAKAAGAYEFVTNAGNVYLTAGTELKWVYYQGNGGVQTWATRVRITKVGALEPAGTLPTDSLTLTNNLTVGGTTTLANVGTYDYSTGVAKMPYIILKKVGNQTLTAANTFYDVAWDGADTYNYQMTHSSSTNNHQITIQKAGVYEINYKLGVNNSTGHVSGQISINGVAQSNFVQRVGNNSGQFEKVQLVQATTLAVGDVVAIQAAAGTAGVAADAVCVASIRMIVPT